MLLHKQGGIILLCFINVPVESINLPEEEVNGIEGGIFGLIHSCHSFSANLKISMINTISTPTNLLIAVRLTYQLIKSSIEVRKEAYTNSETNNNNTMTSA